MDTNLKSLLAILAQRYSGLRNKNVLILFSAGLDTTFLVQFLSKCIGARVTAIHVETGSVFGGQLIRNRIQERAQEAGAAETVFLESQEQMESLLVSAINAEGQLFRGHHPASSLSRIAISQALVKYAASSGSRDVFHGSNGHQNNAFRFHGAIRFFSKELETPLQIHAPGLDFTIPRDLQKLFLEMNGIRHADVENNMSTDDNYFGFEVEETTVISPKNRVDPELFFKSYAAPDQPCEIAIRFRKGVPTAIKLPSDNQWTDASPVSILKRLNAVLLPYRVGISDYPEPRPIGIQAREIHIAPGMSALIRAHHLLRSHLFEPVLNRKFETFSNHWSELIMGVNLWHLPEREALDEVLKELNLRIDGEVFFRVNLRTLDLPSVHSNQFCGEGSRSPATRDDVENYLDGAEMENLAVPSRMARQRNELLSRVSQLIDSSYAHFNDRHSEIRLDKPAKLSVVSKSKDNRSKLRPAT